MIARNNPKIHVWVTKYALTSGITEKEAEHCIDTVPDGNMISVGYFCFHKPDWHLTAEEATLRKQQMILKSIASHKKAIERLEKMSA
jgi:hypothetical protein